MQKLKLHSPDLTQANIDKLAAISELFPHCVTEALDAKGVLSKSVDFDQLRQELSATLVEGPQERYQLNWPGKREALLTANAPIAKTLRPCRAESVDFDTTQNLFIEGDNLDALKLLQETYLNKVKMIYIDPPYNTGNDFIYEDDFAEGAEEFLNRSNQKDVKGNRLVANTETNGRFHSDWLTMIYPRLKLARNLLRDDGVIFISIDDNEFHNLRKVCDEVFGENNCLGIIANINNPKGRSDDKFIATAHEYLLAYAKEKTAATVFGFEPDEVVIKRYNKVDNLERIYREMDLRKTGDADKRADRPDMFYYFYCDSDGQNLRVSKGQDFKLNQIEITPSKDDGTDGRWRWGFNTASTNLNQLYAKFMPTRKIWGIVEKDYLENRPPVKCTSAWTFKDVNSERGSEQFIELGFGKEEFSRPKPIGTLTRVLEVGTIPNEESIALDFFSGSAGFAQAALELNKSNTRNIRFILVQMPEICDPKTEAYKAGFQTIAEIGKERIRRAGKKIKAECVVTNPDLDIGFRVLKIDSSNMKEVFYTPDAVSQDLLSDQVNNIREDRTSEDLLFQVLLDWGVDLSLPISQETIDGKPVFFVDANLNGNPALAACFETDINEDFVKLLAKRAPLRVVFRDAGFANDSVKINVEQIFKLLSPGTEVKTI